MFWTGDGINLAALSLVIWSRLMAQVISARLWSPPIACAKSSLQLVGKHTLIALLLSNLFDMTYFLTVPPIRVAPGD